MISGEINVERFRDITERHRRQLAWWYLKEYWRAEKEDKSIVLELYGEILEQALEKYRSVRFT